MSARTRGPVRVPRRAVLSGLASGASCLALPAWAQPAVAPAADAAMRARFRVIIDNDFSGDPDGLFQLAHHLLSPSVEIPFIIGSHIHENDFLDGSSTQADNAAARARALIDVMRLPSPPPVFAGRNKTPKGRSDAVPTDVTRRIIAEALREDTDIPLVYAAGAGLTELAQAIRIAPSIASRIRLVWIGGMEWPQYVGGAPLLRHPEYNMTIDFAATQTIFNESDIEVWQIPRSTYRQLIVSMAELRMHLQGAHDLGSFLLDALDRVRLSYPDHMGETYILGDSPLVTLTALLSSFEPDTSSSEYVSVGKPHIADDYSYVPSGNSARMRVYRSIDVRLTLSDMFARFAASRSILS